MPTSTYNVFTIFKPIQSVLNYYQNGVRYIMRPIIVITFGIVMIATKSKSMHCPSTLPKFDYSGSDLVNKYFSSFDVYSNVNNLSAAEYILIGFLKHSEHTYELQNKLINVVGQVGDHIYFSGISANFACETFCLTSTIEPTVAPDDCLPLTRLNHSFICQGWENPALVPGIVQNMVLINEKKSEDIVLKKLSNYTREFVRLRKELTEIKVQFEVLDFSATVEQGHLISRSNWFLNMKYLLELIHDLYRDCIPDSYVEMNQQIQNVKSLLPDFTASRPGPRQATAIMALMNKMIPEVQTAIIARGEESVKFSKLYAQNYLPELTEAKRAWEGLFPQLRESKMLRGKKFFISPSYQYLGNGSSQLFPNCNMSMLKREVYDSIQERPFAALIFKR